MRANRDLRSIENARGQFEQDQLKAFDEQLSDPEDRDRDRTSDYGGAKEPAAVGKSYRKSQR